MAQTSVLIHLGRWIDTGENTNSFRNGLQRPIGSQERLPEGKTKSEKNGKEKSKMAFPGDRPQ